MSRVLRCSACGVFVEAEDRFCWSCGSEIGRGESQRRAAAPPPPPQLELDPESALALRHAYLAERRGRLEEAEQLVLSVLEREPEAVPALSMLAGILRAKGDLIGSVTAAQRAAEAAAGGRAPPGAVERAREERARVEEQVLRELGGPLNAGSNPISAFQLRGTVWYRSRQLFLALAAMGTVALFLAVVAVLQGAWSGYAWFGVSLVSAGWCYNDAESRRQAGIAWASFVLCLGPFGLAIYLLAMQ